MAGSYYRDRITVQRQAEGTDDYGNTKTAWELLTELWANVRPVPGKERIASGAVQATAMATIRVRNSATARGVTAGDRVVCRGETWNIRSEPIVMGDRREMIEFTCETGVAT